MKYQKNYNWIRPVLFILAGMLVGLAVYFLAGCPNGNCVITSNPIRSMVYLGLAGWLLSHGFEK